MLQTLVILFNIVVSLTCAFVSSFILFLCHSERSEESKLHPSFYNFKNKMFRFAQHDKRKQKQRAHLLSKPFVNYVQHIQIKIAYRLVSCYDDVCELFVSFALQSKCG